MRSQFPDLYDRNIKNAYVQGYGDPDHEFEQFYNVESMDTSDERWTEVTGLGQWQLKDPGDNVAYAAISAGYNNIITPSTYALAFIVEQESYEDDPRSILGSQLAARLAESGKDTVETLAAAPFNAPTSTSGFSPWQTSTSTGATGSSPDGVALLSTVHPIVTGGFYANTPAVACTLSKAALAASKLRLQKMQGAHGQLWALQGEKLVVPADLQQTADEILLTPTEPYSPNLTKNVVATDLTRVTWSRLTSATTWLVFAKKAPAPGQKGFGTICKWRIKPEFDRDGDFQSGDRLYKGRFRIGFGYYTWRGIDGSPGV
jgi:hypothetical protein